MSEFLDKAPAKIVKMVEKLKTLTKDTVYEDHVFLVGGCVRDVLLGRSDKIRDIDIVVDLNKGGIAFACWLTNKTHCYHLNTNPCMLSTYDMALSNITTDPDLDGFLIESTQTRKNMVKTAPSEFGTIDKDVLTRDFTVNSIYYDITHDKLIDLTGNGLQDIKKRILRTPTNPNMTFSSDPLRILRGIRLACTCGLKFETNTWLAMVTNAYKIKSVSEGRKTIEFDKIILSDTPSEGIEMLSRANLLSKMFPEMSTCQHVYNDLRPKRTVYQHTLECLDKTPAVLETRLAAFFHDIGKAKTYKNSFLYHQLEGSLITEELMEKMFYDKNIIKTVCDVIEHHEDFSAWRGDSLPRAAVVKRFIEVLDKNEKTINVALDVIHANNITQMYGKRARQVQGIRARIKEIEAAAKKEAENKKQQFPINGKDLINSLGLKPGPLFATLMNKVKAEYRKNPNLTKEEALEMVKQHLKAVV